MNKFNAKARRKARQLVLQALYQLQFNHSSVQEVETQFLEDTFSKNADEIYFKELLLGVLEHLADIDKLIEPYLDRPIKELTPIELGVLRIAAYELKMRPDVPYRVIINEALELTKSFGSTDGHKYVNGILDNLAKKLRAEEMKL